MDDTSALPAVTTKPRPRMAAVVGGMGATAVVAWAAAIYFAAVHHPVEAIGMALALAVAMSAVTAVAWAVWHLRSKGSLEHRLVVKRLDDLDCRVNGLQVAVAGVSRDMGARMRQARDDGYVEAAHDFGINPGGGDDPGPPSNARSFLRPVRGGGRPDVG